MATPEKENSSKPNIWAASSAVVAACALVFSVYQGYKVREHDRLGVTPRMLLEFGFRTDGVGWKLSNRGLGPAEIRGFSVAVDGADKHNWVEVLKALNITHGTYDFAVPYANGTVYPVGTELKLFWLPPEFTEYLTKNFHRVRIEIVYCSLYKECWSINEKADLLKEAAYPEIPFMGFKGE